MPLLERYIFRIALSAFVACLVGLSAVIWITQALRQFDVVTAQGQTLLVFLSLTGLSLPTLVAVIAPIALFIATLYALNRLNGDSELIVMSAAGMKPRLLIRPFLVLGTLVAAAIFFLTVVIIPASFQEIRDLIAKIRADFVANIAQEGQFTTLDNGVTFQYRERQGGALMGIFLQDRREEGRSVTYLAERGQAVDHNGGSFLILENGSVHRQGGSTAAAPDAPAREAKGGRGPAMPAGFGSGDTSIVAFERYAIDLSALNQEAGELVYKPRERSTGDLLLPDRNETYYQAQSGRFRAELHDRLSAWILPIAMVFIAFAALGRAQTTRQGRGAALAGAVVAVVALRIGIFAASSALVRSPGAVWAVYGLPLGAIAISALLIGSDGRWSDRLFRLPLATRWRWPLARRPA